MANVLKLIKQVAIILTLQFLYVQGIFAQDFTTALKKLNAEAPKEKIYIQYDREVYYPGETIWFKSYLFSGSYPSDISGILYADLLDEKGNLLTHKILPVFASGASGSFQVPANTDGELFVRAYTKWMLNFDSSALYHRSFFVSSTRQPRNDASGIRVQFFPESGELIEEVESRVIIKSKDERGRGYAISGTIANSADNTIINFRTDASGTGEMRISPLKNAVYTATWTVGTVQRSLKLPLAQKTGVAFELAPAKDGFIYTLKRSEAVPDYKFVYVVGQMNQQIIYQAKIPVDELDLTSGKIPTTGLPGGLAEFVVFRPDLKIVCERFAMVNPGSASFSIGIKTMHCESKARGMNEIQLELTDTIAANLSVSVSSAAVNNDPAPGNIYTGLVLNNAIETGVGASYFKGGDSAEYKLDMAMICEQGRPLNWDEILSNTSRKISFSPDKSLSIEGKIGGLKKEEVSKHDLVGLFESKKASLVYGTTQVDKEYKFGFSNLNFYDSAKFYYGLNNDKKSELSNKMRVQAKSNVLENGLRMPVKRTVLATEPLGTEQPGYQLFVSSKNYADSFYGKTLKGVTVKSVARTRKDSINAEYTTGLFDDMGNSKILIPDDDPSAFTYPSVLEYINGRFPGVMVDPSQDTNPVTWRFEATALYVDEIPQVITTLEMKLIQDASYIRTIPMSDVAMIKLLSPPFIGSSGNGPGGALAIYRKRGHSTQQVNVRPYVQVRGYSYEKDFASPDYSAGGPPQPDYRTTLYWNPNILLDSKHRSISIKYYNNDSPGPLTLVIEGFNADGKLVRVERVIECK